MNLRRFRMMSFDRSSPQSFPPGSIAARQAIAVAVLCWSAISFAALIDDISVKCPPATVIHGMAPPRGNEQWCEAKEVSGKRQGPYVRWFRNGKRELALEFRDGAMDGAMRRWTPTGRLVERGDWRNGEKEGIWVEWYESGQRKSETPY